MNSSKTIILEGAVEEALPNTTFRVKVEDEEHPEFNGKIVLCYLSGRMRIHYIKIMPGDKVRFEMTSYDPGKGRITYRFK